MEVPGMMVAVPPTTSGTTSSLLSWTKMDVSASIVVCRGRSEALDFDVLSSMRDDDR